MKRLMSLVNAVLADASTWCCTSTLRDSKTITERIEYEGVSFLTITLPNFCKDFERGLEQRFIGPSQFAGFAKSGELPRFLGGFLDLVFDRSTGVILDVPDVQAIFFVRQITLLCKKIRLDCTAGRTRSAVSGYVQSNVDVRDWEQCSSDRHISDFRNAARCLFTSVLSPLDERIALGECIPKHGPGATADRIAGNRKYDQVVWPERLNAVFPVEDFVVPNFGFYEELQRVTLTDPEHEVPVKVTPVPKTLKTPRIIAMEPVCMQYAQQAIALPLTQLLESSKMRSSLGFRDQQPNRRLAKDGSSTGRLATLDLKEASDRVSNLLVRNLFPDLPHLTEAVQATRSLRASLPDKSVIDLFRFASMGSALCFPIEAMVFLTVLFVGWQRYHLVFGKGAVRPFLESVRIYGDDIIIPVDFVPEALLSLESFGIKVNKDKSFWNGKFRESCGGDYYDGSDVSVVYCRTMPPQGLHCALDLAAWTAMRNLFYHKGLWNTAASLDRWFGEFMPYPLVGDQSAVLGRHSLLGYSAERQCPKLYRPQVYGVTLRAKKRKSVASGPGALLKYFLNASDECVTEKDHLEYSGRPLSVNTKKGWAYST